jgi:hypothetical protein
MMRVGIRGGSVLAIAGVIGVYLSSTGWQSRNSGLPVQAPTTAVAGSLLSSSPYASQSYQIWPGTPSAAARRAEAGLTVTVTRSAGGINVSIAVKGTYSGSQYYPSGARVYVISPSPGNQSLVVTDAKGRIVA